MTPYDRVRAAALDLPETEERPDGGSTGFRVAGQPFVEVTGDTLRVRDGDGWVELSLAGEVDWPLVEDRIAHGWELAAPAALLEAGGR